jgi:hypothetical protein
MRISAKIQVARGKRTATLRNLGTDYSHNFTVQGSDFLLEEEIDDSDSMDETQEMVGFELVVGAAKFGSGPASASHIDAGELLDNSSATPDDKHELDSKFANVSSSPILPLQSSLLGFMGVGGSMFEFSVAREVTADGLVHR